MNAFIRSLITYFGVSIRAAALWNRADIEKIEKRV